MSGEAGAAKVIALNSTVEAPSGMSRSGGSVGVVGMRITSAWLRQTLQPLLGMARISSPILASSLVMREAISKRSLIAGDNASAWASAKGISVDCSS